MVQTAEKSKGDAHPAKHIQLSVCRIGMTARFALLLMLLVFLPMIVTGILIEKGVLVPGKTFFLAIPVLFIILLFPFAKLLSHWLVNRDLLVLTLFCNEIKKGNYNVSFNLGNEKEEEEPFLVLLRNLTWMSHTLSAREKQRTTWLHKISREYSELEKNLSPIS